MIPTGLLIGILLAGYAILDGFDLGVGVLHLFAKNERQRNLHLAAIGPVWDGNEVWLLTAGGAMFAAFPVVYAGVFSGFYLAFVLLLVGLIFRAVSMEFRGQVDSPAWRSAWDWAFGLGSLVPAILFGLTGLEQPLRMPEARKLTATTQRSRMARLIAAFRLRLAFLLIGVRQTLE